MKWTKQDGLTFLPWCGLNLVALVAPLRHPSYFAIFRLVPLEELERLDVEDRNGGCAWDLMDEEMKKVIGRV